MTDEILYSPRGYLAVAPQALGAMFVMAEPRPQIGSTGPIGLVEFAGPLSHHAGRGPSYDGIKSEIRARFESEAKVVLVSGDTLGGDTAGAFDTAQEIRAMRLQYGKPLLWYVDAYSCSSGYGLACAADRIYCPPGGFVGSIGVLYALPDETARDAAMGVKWVIIRTGDHKSDGNSHIPMSEAAIAEVAKHCESTGELFYEWVRERRGISVDVQRGWAGRMFQGAEGLALGLVDQIATFDEVVAMVTADLEGNGKALTGGGNSMSQKVAVAALRAAAEKCDNEEDKKEFSKAIAKLEASEPDGDEAKKKEEEAKAKAAASEPDGDEAKKKEEEAKAKAAASEPDGDEKKTEGAKAMAMASALKSRLDDHDRTALLDGRKDLPPAFRAHCEKLSVPEVRALLAITPLFPKATSQVEASRAAIGVAPSATGSGAGGGAPRTKEDEELDAMMGIEPDRPVVEHTSLGAVFRACTPERARAAHAAYLKDYSSAGNGGMGEVVS